MVALTATTYVVAVGRTCTVDLCESIAGGPPGEKNRYMTKKGRNLFLGDRRRGLLRTYLGYTIVERG